MNTTDTNGCWVEIASDQAAVTEHVPSMSPTEFAHKLGGELIDGWIIFPDPYDETGQRLLTFRIVECAPDGFIVRTTGGEDPAMARKRVSAALEKFGPKGSIVIDWDQAPPEWA